MDRAANKDVISDPAHADEGGRDWADEGGALGTGPATDPGEDALEEPEPEPGPEADEQSDRIEP